MCRCLKLAWFFVVVAACAASPVVDFPHDAPAFEPEPDPEVEGREPDDERDEVAEVAEADEGAASDAASAPSSSSSPLASADAGASDREAGSAAAGSASPDAGRRDAGATRPSLLPPLPGGLDLGSLSPPRTRACTAAKDCTVACFPIGFFSCCRLDNICGCSWAPGAYCL